MTRFALGLFAAALVASGHEMRAVASQATALISTSAPARPAQDAKAKELIEKAMAATAGKDKAADAKAVLEKFAAGTSKMEGKMNVGGMSLPFTGSMVYAAPGKIRMDLSVSIGGQKVELVQVVNGKGVRQTENGKPAVVGDAAKTELMQGALLQEVALLYPLLDAARFTLQVGFGSTDHDAVEVDGKDGGLKKITLFFNKKTGLLDKMTRKGLSPTGAEVDEETVYTDYKDAGGIKVPMVSKVSHNGKEFLDIKVTEFKALDKVDEKFDTGN